MTDDEEDDILAMARALAKSPDAPGRPKPLIKPKKEEIVPLNKALCKRVLGLESLKRERPFDQDHAQTLRDHMILGTFNWELVMLGLIQYNGTWHRCNGQHTAMAALSAILADESFVPGNVKVLTYKAESLEQVRRIYASFDTNKPRTSAHLLAVLTEGSALERQITLPYLQKYAAGFRHWQYGPREAGRQRHSPETLIRHFQSTRYNALLLAVHSVATKKVSESNRYGLLSGCCAAMFECFDKQPRKGPEFWTKVLSGLNMTSDSDPAFWLRTMYSTAHIRKARQSKGWKQYSQEDNYRLSVLCFNKWLQNESATRLSIPSERIEALRPEDIK